MAILDGAGPGLQAGWLAPSRRGRSRSSVIRRRRKILRHLHCGKKLLNICFLTILHYFEIWNITVLNIALLYSYKYHKVIYLVYVQFPGMSQYNSSHNICFFLSVYLRCHLFTYNLLLLKAKINCMVTCCVISLILLISLYPLNLLPWFFDICYYY